MKLVFFFIMLGIVFVAICSCRVIDRHEVYQKGSFWNDGFFQQNTVRTAYSGDYSVEALIDGVWKKFELRELPSSFMKWNIERRLKDLGQIQEGRRPDWAGPHNGVVATKGLRREDSSFSLNNAVKGMGFLPKAHKIDEMIKTLAETKDSLIEEKLAILTGFYENVEEIYDLDKQVSLELYPTPEFETQTFINQMSYPVSAIVYLDVPSFKLKTITRLLHPDDPDLTDYEQKVVRFVNDVYSYFHGDRGRDFITTVYYVVEVYDNSPGRRDARGLRIE